jgi:hypothetical protein
MAYVAVQGNECRESVEKLEKFRVLRKEHFGLFPAKAVGKRCTRHSQSAVEPRGMGFLS